MPDLHLLIQMPFSLVPFAQVLEAIDQFHFCWMAI
jgi:hypothetical protein